MKVIIISYFMFLLPLMCFSQRDTIFEGSSKCRCGQYDLIYYEKCIVPLPAYTFFSATDTVIILSINGAPNGTMFEFGKTSSYAPKFFNGKTKTANGSMWLYNKTDAMIFVSYIRKKPVHFYITKERA